MRIGIMGPAGFGGAARTAIELAAELARREHRIHLFTPTKPFHYREYMHRVILHQSMGSNPDHAGPMLTDWPAPQAERFVSLLLKVIAEDRLDILHLHYAIPFASFAAAVRRRLGSAAPVLIGTLHGGDVTIASREPQKRSALLRSLSALDALTTVSRHYADLASEAFDLITPPKVIPNFVDLSQFRPLTSFPSASPTPVHGDQSAHSRSRIVHVSNFRPVKDPQSAARIFLGIREKLDAELWLVGDGPGLADITSILEEEKVSDDIRLWGLQQDVASILAGADLLLITSLTENFSLAALEAMACGVPVLATDVGGCREVIIQGKTGFLFPSGDHQLAVALAVGLLTDPIKHAAFKEAASNHVSRFGCPKIVSSYEELYRRLVAERSTDESWLASGL